MEESAQPLPFLRRYWSPLWTRNPVPVGVKVQKAALDGWEVWPRAVPLAVMYQPFQETA